MHRALKTVSHGVLNVLKGWILVHVMKTLRQYDIMIYTVYTVYTLYTVYTVYIVYTLYTVYALYTV